jgi:hypothetical protein
MTISFISSAAKYWLRRKVAGLVSQKGDEATETFNTSQTNIWLKTNCGALVSDHRMWVAGCACFSTRPLRLWDLGGLR